MVARERALPLPLPHGAHVYRSSVGALVDPIEWEPEDRGCLDECAVSKVAGGQFPVECGNSSGWFVGQEHDPRVHVVRLRRAQRVSSGPVLQERKRQRQAAGEDPASPSGAVSEDGCEPRDRRDGDGEEEGEQVREVAEADVGRFDPQRLGEPQREYLHHRHGAQDRRLARMAPAQRDEAERRERQPEEEGSLDRGREQ